MSKLLYVPSARAPKTDRSRLIQTFSEFLSSSEKKRENHYRRSRVVYFESVLDGLPADGARVPAAHEQLGALQARAEVVTRVEDGVPLPVEADGTLARCPVFHAGVDNCGGRVQ